MACRSQPRYQCAEQDPLAKDHADTVESVRRCQDAVAHTVVKVALEPRMMASGGATLRNRWQQGPIDFFVSCGLVEHQDRRQHGRVYRGTCSTGLVERGGLAAMLVCG